MPEAAPVAPAPSKTTAPPGKSPVVPTKPQAIAKGMPPSTTEKAGEPVDDDPVIWEGKVDGEHRKVKKSESDRLFSKGAYADKLIRKATETAKALKAEEERINSISGRMKTETEASLRDAGVDVEAFARAILERKVAEAQMSPEQRELAAAKAEAKALQEKLQGVEKSHGEKQQQAVEAQLAKNMDKQLAAAAQKIGLETNDEAFYAMYEALNEAHRLGLPWDPDRIADVAKENIEGAQSRLESAVLKGLKGESLLKRLGPAVTDAVLAAKLEQIRAAKRPGGTVAAAPVVPPPAPKPSHYITNAEAEERFRQLRRK